jgi:zinc/manganese transport system substrate-binding protein
MQLAVSLIVSSLPFLGAGGSPAPDRLKVVTTLPELADLAERIGGERVEVQALCRGTENAHRVVTKPSHLAAMARADVFVQVGLSLEMSFVPALLLSCRNPDIQPGAPGFVDVSVGWEAIQVPVQISRAAGDVHPQGNPHMNLDPRAPRHAAARVLAGLQRVDPASAADYQQRYDAYLAELAQAEQRWATAGKDWHGSSAVVYHLEYDYLLAHYGVEVLGSIELKPGIPPTPRHLADLVDKMRRERPAAILTAKWSNNNHVEELAKRTDTPVVELPNMAGASERTRTWIGMLDFVHESLARVFGREREGG